MTGHGGWPMTVFLTPGGRAVLRRHLLPAGAAARAAELPAGARGGRRAPGASGATTSRARPAQLVEAVRQLGVAPPVDRAADRRACSPDAARAAARGVRAGVRRLGAGAEVPARSRARVPAPPRRRRRASAMVDEDARRDGGRRDVRPARRRLPPLLGRRPLARAALREDAVRQRAARAGVPARLARHRRRALPRRSQKRRSSTCSASCCSRRAASPRRRTPTRTASRASRSRGRRTRASRPSCCEPFEHGRSIIRGELDEELRARLFELREQRPKPLRDDKAIASWNGLALAALAEAGRRLERPDWVDAARTLGEFLLGPLSDDGRPASAQLPRRPHERSRLSRRLRERRARAARAPRRDRRAALARGGEPARAARGRALRRRGARRLLPLAGRRRAARRADEGPRRPPASVRQLDARARAAAARADLRRRRARAARRSPCSASCGPRSSARPTAFGWALCALDLHLSPPRELAIVGPVDSEVARAALAPWQPNTVVAVGPADEVPLLAGKTLVDGKPAVYVCERFACRAPVTDPALSSEPFSARSNFPGRPLSKFTRRSNLALPAGLFSTNKGRVFYA